MPVVMAAAVMVVVIDTTYHTTRQLLICTTSPAMPLPGVVAAVGMAVVSSLLSLLGRLKLCRRPSGLGSAGVAPPLPPPPW